MVLWEVVRISMGLLRQLKANSTNLRLRVSEGD